MKVVLIGATGFVGSHILEELISRNYEVTAIARDVSKIKDKKSVIAIQLDVNNKALLESALKGNEVVISAFNAGWANPEIYDDFIKGARNIIEAVKEAHIPRFIVIGGAGSLLLEDNKLLIDSPDFPKEIKPGAMAATDLLEIIKRENDLDWTFFSPAIEMNPTSSRKRTGKYRTNTDHPVFNENGRSQLSVEDLAVAIVDEIENKKFIKKRFTAGY